MSPAKDDTLNVRIPKEMSDQIAEISLPKSELIRNMINFAMHDFEHRNDPIWIFEMVVKYISRLGTVIEDGIGGTVCSSAVAVPALKRHPSPRS